MAQRPTTLWGFRDLLLPTMHTLCSVHDITMDIFWSPQCDHLSIKALSRDGSRYDGLLLTKQEIEDNAWHDVVRDRFLVAVNAVKPQSSEGFAEEYEEIMQAQDLMNEIKP